jgi:aminoglycoside phosphotransferase (APT) family kinase protein
VRGNHWNRHGDVGDDALPVWNSRHLREGPALIAIDVPLVRALITGQFPQWADLPIAPVIPGGVDHRTFRLGSRLLVRLPSAEGYAVQVEKEQRWLPRLAAALPVPIPVPVARGGPGHGYPFDWSVYGWLDGRTVLDGADIDLPGVAVDVAAFLRDLHAVDTSDGPGPGLHTGYRGGPASWYDAETRSAIDALADVIDADRATRMWERALAAPYAGPGVWFHGDVAPGNLLLRGGRLSAVIDFGCAGVGDPACDLVIAWTLLEAPSRNLFHANLDPDDGCWARGQGWALWKALIVQRELRGPGGLSTDGVAAAETQRVLTALFADAG